MHHEYIDRFSRGQSPVHRLDARVKIIVLVAWVVMMVLTPAARWWQITGYVAFLGGMVLVSRVPVGYLLVSALRVLPFVLATIVLVPFMREGRELAGLSLGAFRLGVTDRGLAVFLNVLVRSYLGVLAMLCLVSTTPFSRLLEGMERLRVPRIMIAVLSFLYRFLFVLVDQAGRIKRARDARSFGAHGPGQLRVLGHMVASLFVRTWQRSERVYQAMCARGFDGHVRTLGRARFGAVDAVMLIAGLLFLGLFWVIP